LTRTLNEGSTAVDIARAYKLNVVVSSFAPSRGFTFRAAGQSRQDAWVFRAMTTMLYPKYFEAARIKTSTYVEQDRRFESILREDEFRKIAKSGRDFGHLDLTSDENDLNDDQRTSILELFETSGYANWIRDTEFCFQKLCGEVPKAHRRRTRDLKAVLHL
jgi:hypothetical protein